MAFISLTTAPDAQKQLAETVRILREKRKFSRKALAEVSTVPEATIKKFETTGQISLRQFLLLWQSLADLQPVTELFRQTARDAQQPAPRSIDDVLKG